MAINFIWSKKLVSKQEVFETFLLTIKGLIEKRRKSSVPVKIYISYAWYRNEKQDAQLHLRLQIH
jgi:hypothetical protein